MCSSYLGGGGNSVIPESFLPESERVRENSAFLVRFEVTFVRGNAVNKARGDGKCRSLHFKPEIRNS